MAESPVDRLARLGLTLPPPPRPAGTYTPVVRSGTLAWVSGQIATDSGTVVRPGSVDRDLSVEEAQGIARRATLQALSALEQSLGSIDRIRRAVRVGVFVAVSPGFHREHEVANGATQLLVDLFGEDGRPARSTVGVAGLPLGAPVEVELLVETG
ncbi:MAG: RidA family protein [Thermoplasmata archaeon]